MTFEEGLAVGLLLGKKKGGGNAVYRDMLQNHIPVWTQNIDSIYKFTIAVWRGDAEYGLPGSYYSPDYRYQQSVWQTDSEHGSASENPRYYFNTSPNNYTSLIVILYKNDNPLYIVVNNQNLGSYYEYYSNAHRETGENTWENIICLTKGAATLDRVDNIDVEPLTPEIRYDEWRNGRYETTTLSYDIYHSRDEYIIVQENPTDYPTVEKDGDRRVYRTSVSYPTEIEILPGSAPVYTELSGKELFDEVQNLTIAVHASAGITYSKPQIVYPD